MSLASSMLGGFQLPITRRGRFLEDDFFSGFQNNYERAVDDVLDRWGTRKSLADRLASYRRLREKDTSDETKAATITETEDAYMIVLDMSDFASGEITVQTSGFFAVVDGKAPPRVFNRRFPLPKTTVIDRVVADLSDDNILKITAPKKGAKSVAVNLEGADTSSSIQQQTSASSVEEQIVPTQTGSSLNQAPGGSRVIPLEVEGQATSTSTSTSTSSARVESVAQAVQNEELCAGRSGSNTRIIPLNIEGDDDGSSFSSITSTSSSSSHNRVLPIKRRGRFLQDTTFEKVWKDFEAALDEVVARRGSTAGLEDDKMQSYRNLRQCVQQEDNQAANVSKDEGEVKIVVDVKDFADGHLDVKAEDGAIVVKGKKGPCSFERRFSLPTLSQPDKVTAALSDDGILTVTAPV
ncbi:uncharacterized protein LOC122251540 [Penaeus japonicus]|uniref:uncharacterized protein LOC122251540 n=1 Tax=Penaeus japonicus TaxID=27405 RepID=UPI001C716F7B|nr:uncharacterized protein LOC122251540 [Penaeus japonicus]